MRSNNPESYLDRPPENKWSGVMEALRNEAGKFATDMVTGGMPVTEVLLEKDTRFETATEAGWRGLRYPAWVVLQWHDLTGQAMAGVSVTAATSVGPPQQRKIPITTGNVREADQAVKQAESDLWYYDYHHLYVYYDERAIGVLPNGETVKLIRRENFDSAEGNHFSLSDLPPFEISEGAVSPEDILDLTTDLSEERLIAVIKQRLCQSVEAYAAKRDGKVVPTQLYGQNYLEPRVYETSWLKSPKELERANSGLPITRGSSSGAWRKLKALFMR